MILIILCTFCAVTANTLSPWKPPTNEQRHNFELKVKSEAHIRLDLFKAFPKGCILIRTKQTARSLCSIFFSQNNCLLLFCCNFKSVWLPWRGVLFLWKRHSRANECGYKHHYILSVILVFTAGNVRNLCSNLLLRLTFKVTEEAVALMPRNH